VAELSNMGDLTRSQIVAYETAHLEDAALRWAKTGNEWEDHFSAIHQGTLAPGGTEWEGAGADAAQDGTFADLVKVRGMADHLYAAAAAAHNGADDIRWAKHQALSRIANAEAAGFLVGEDLSVTDRSVTPLMGQARALRQAQAEAFAADIRSTASNLAAVDNAVARKVVAALSPLRQSGFAEPADDGSIQAVDFREAPPPSPAYPINDVIAEATDLDGNHVVMRRGYYDATTGKGFGWDKAYWRHGVVNPNVFTDLISHSRPISSDGGTLVYEVPINRVHCTSGTFGIASCDDTGESVTMRIVVNTNPSVDVPGGGQKGLISMYPRAGGSGVVELGPNWTWTPPWVNNNVPIN
jgi:hypothetical protein